MNKSVLNNIEKMQEKRKLSGEAKEKIKARLVANWAIGIAILILLLTFNYAANYLEKNIAIFIYNVYAVHFCIVALVVIEIAYKKDNR